MVNYTTKNINIITLIISAIIFTIINLTIQPSQAQTTENGEKKENEEKVKIEEIMEISSQKKEEEWNIEIPIIGLKAPIAEGVESNILQQYVGHFEETAKREGNVGLAAHNRGYKVNYFERIKELKMEDEIYYNCEGTIRKYKVNKIKIIKDTDWSYLGETKENKITLITCVENKPELRRCIQGIEIKGGI